MSRNNKRNCGGSYHRKFEQLIKKYPMNCDVSPSEVFNVPFLCDNKTISYIKKHGRIMFIIRGPPYTMKTKLSDLLKNVYPNAVYCSAVKQIDKYIDGKELADKTIKNTTHSICQKLASEGCKDNKLVIVQNSHMKKFELKFYLDLAALHDYVVIMAITTYKFDITIKALEEEDINRNGCLGHSYLSHISRNWEDNPPMYTGWFMSPEDSESVRYFTQQILETLSQCETVREQFSDGIVNYFLPRQILSCLAGYTNDLTAMKKYYLSDLVQLSYGKCFNLTIVGYLLTKSDILGIVHLDCDMKSLILFDINQDNDMLTSQTPRNLSHHGKTKQFLNKENSKSRLISESDWLEGEELNIAMSSFIHIAQKSFNIFNLKKLKKNIYESLQMVADTNGIIHQDVYTLSKDETTRFCKLANNAWLVKSPKKISMKSIFTGFYPD